MEGKVGFDIDRLNNVARELTDVERMRMNDRRKNRYWITASSAIALKIKRRLKEMGISQLELAEILGITAANVTRYLSGKTNFELKTLIEIERAIGVHIIDQDIISPQSQTKTLNVNVTFTLPPVEIADTNSEDSSKIARIDLSSIKGKSKKLYVYG